jgi:hypothetical protein
MRSKPDFNRRQVWQESNGSETKVWSRGPDVERRFNAGSFPKEEGATRHGALVLVERSATKVQSRELHGQRQASNAERLHGILLSAVLKINGYGSHDDERADRGEGLAEKTVDRAVACVRP